MNLDLTEEQKQDLVKNGPSNLLRKLNSVLEAHKAEARERTYQRIKTQRELSSLDDTMSGTAGEVI